MKIPEVKIPATKKKIKVHSKKGILASMVSGFAFVILTFMYLLSQKLGFDVPPEAIGEIGELIPMATPLPPVIGTETDYVAIVDSPGRVSQWARDMAFIIPWLGTFLISLGAFLKSVGIVPKDD